MLKGNLLFLFSSIILTSVFSYYVTLWGYWNYTRCLATTYRKHSLPMFHFDELKISLCHANPSSFTTSIHTTNVAERQFITIKYNSSLSFQLPCHFTGILKLSQCLATTYRKHSLPMFHFDELKIKHFATPILQVLIHQFIQQTLMSQSQHYTLRSCYNNNHVSITFKMIIICDNYDTAVHMKFNVVSKCFMALFPGPPGWAGARRGLLDFMVQGRINRGRHTDHPDGSHCIRTSNQCPPQPSPILFTGRMPFLPPNQQCQSTEGN